ncbi:MAG: hypothetical protein WDM78_22240 [Puia sp.]
MNVQDYISSGIVESYVLGLSSPAESAEFERMCAAHHEVLAARNAFEIQLEQRFQEQKLEAPRELKSRIFFGNRERKIAHQPHSITQTVSGTTNWFRQICGCLLLLVLLAGSVLLNFYLLGQYKKNDCQK